MHLIEHSRHLAPAAATPASAREAHLDEMADVIVALVEELGPISSRELVDAAAARLSTTRDQAKFGLNHAQKNDLIFWDRTTSELSALGGDR